MKTTKLITATISAFVAAMAWAIEVSPQQAALAARAWAAAGDPMGVRLGSNVIASEQYVTNGASFHAVKLDGGIVFTSADTESEPIIGFTSSTEFDPSPENPLMMILSRDAMVRARMAADATKRAFTQGSSSRTTSATSSSSRWEALIAEGQALEANPGQHKLSSHLSSVSDVRVDPLTRTEWNQSTANGKNCYNYYTPECHKSDGTLTRALCGCSATALSQVIRYWEYPKSSVQSKQYQCYVLDYSNGSSYGYYTNIWTLAGTYDWAHMTEKPASTSGMTDVNYRAIGRLTHDCAVALMSDFSASSTGASPDDQKPALKNAFGFACAQYYWDSTWLSQNTLGNSETLHRRAIYAPLDAGAPVMFAIYRYYNGNIYGGHCVVGDGYGYENVCGEQTPFVHINLGWGGSWDFWYNLPDVDTGSYGSKTGNYNVFGGVIYNIFPTNTGEVVSGRILNASGNPVSGATVAIARKGTTDVLKTTTSSSHGVYAFIVPAGYQYDVEAQASDGSFGSHTTATVPASSSSAIGNSWGNDITLQSLASLPDLVANCYLTTSANSASPSTSFGEGQDIYAQAEISNSGGSSASGPFYVLHELLNSSDNVIGSESVAYTGTLEQSDVYTFDPRQFSFMQNLAAGSYKYRVTVDSDDSVREWHEDNNTAATFSFYVSAVPPPPVSLEIVGASSIAAGEMATYTCMVNFSDGTRRSVTPTWTIDSGASYASVDSNGTVTAGLNDASHTILLRATCELHCVPMTATAAITILPVIPLPIALDNTDLSFNTDSGNSQWYGQAGVSHDGVDAGRSGPISDGGTARMSTSVSGPGTLSFWYYVSSEAGYDRLEFYVDKVNALLPSASGETNSWTHYDVRVNDAGTHTFEWCYVKDGSESEGLDAAFIDQVVWQQRPTPESLEIDGASSLTAGTTAQYTCTVRMSDGTSKIVTPTWSMAAGGQYADISSSGLLSAHESDLDRAVTIGASYTESGITRPATKDVSIIGTLPPPEAPVIITYGAGDSDAAHIAWTEGRYAATYNVYCSADDNFQNAKLIFEGLDAMTRTASNASDPGVGLWYWVSAVNARGEAFSEGREAWRVARIEATPSAISAEAAGASANVSVSANTDWSVEVESGSDGNDYDPDTSNWIALGSRSGTGYGSFGVTVSANPVERERVGVVVVTAAPDTRHPEYAFVRVTQSAYVKPGEPDYAFTLVDGGDAEKVLYTTATSEGPLARIVEAGDDLYARFGWINVGDGPGDGELTHNFSFMDIDMLNVKSEDMFVNGTFEVGQGMSASHSVADMAPGPYLMTGVLNAEGFLKEANPSDNVAEYRFAVRDPLTLGVALCGEEWTAESGITFSTSDDEWFGSAGIGPEGVSGAMTKHGDHGYINTLVATVSGPGTLSFDYRVSSENHDKFSFALDGKTEVNAGGLLDWRTKTIEVKGDGEHEIVWKYSRDAQLVSGLDCALIANVVWEPDTFDAPASVLATDGTSDSAVYVSWSACSGARRYIVARSESRDGAEWSEIGNPASTNYTDTSALGGVTYWYRVKAVYGNGTSDLSEAVDDGWRKTKMLILNKRSVPGESGDDTVTVEANSQWRATTDANWITFAVGEGVGKAKLVYHFDDNDTGSQRTANITVTGAPDSDHPGAINAGSRTFQVVQRKKVDYGSIVSLAAAAGNGATPSRLKFVTSGDAEWVGQTRISHDGTSAMRSGPISDNGKSRVEVTLDRPGTLTFWWGTSSNNGDKLKLYVNDVQVKDGTQLVQIYGNSSLNPGKIKEWKQRSLEITNVTGATVAWVYEKDGSTTSAEDAGFVDQVVWTPASITGHPFGEPVVRDGTPTFFDDMSVTIFDTPAACGDCLAVFDRATDELLMVQRVESEGYIPAFDINGLKANDKLYFKVWNAGSGLDHPEIFESAEPGDLVISDPDDPIVGFNVNITGTKPTYTVSYDLAGKAMRTGGGELTQSVAFGEDAVDPEISVNPGWLFVGWDCSERTSVRCNMSITALYEEVIVPPETYTVTYDPGANGTGSQQTDTKTENVALTLKGAIFTRDGYTQTGWATSDGGARVYGLGASYTANAAVTLYPFWAEDLDPATIRIDTEASYEAEPDGSFMLDLGELIRSATTPTVTVKGLPTGIKFDSKKVVIAGTATKPGISTVTVSVKNKAVKTPVTATFQLVVPNLRCDVLPDLDPAPDAYGIVMCGVAFDPGLVNCSTSASGWTVKVAGLPTGLKYDAKTGTITGVPTKAGTFTVTFTATKKGEKNRVATITLTTEALPTWATGTFTGDVKYGDDYGSATMTVAENGKVSGKVSLGGTNWTFSATSYSSMESPAAFVVDADAKAGKATMRTMLSVVECDAPQSLINSCASGEFGDGTIELWRNMWKDKATAAAAKAEIAKWEGVYTITVDDGGYFSLTVGKTGDVKASGKLSDGTSVSVTAPLMFHFGKDFFTVFCVSPSAYKGGFVFLPVGFGQERGELYPIGDPLVWLSRNPQATGEYGMGFMRSNHFAGAYYDKLKKLNDYYESLRLGTDALPELGFTYKLTHLNEANRKVIDSSAETAPAVDTLWQDGLTVTVNGKGAFVVAKATKPVQDKTTKEWSYNGVNDGALTLSFTQATGIFKGSYTFWYDYMSAFDETKPEGKQETWTHTSKKVSFEGVLVQGVETLRGFYLWDATGEYTDPKTLKLKTYKYKESFSVYLEP